MEAAARGIAKGDEDELTRTRKLRRKFLEQKYASFIEAIYDGTGEFTAEIPVRYQDGRTGAMRATVHANDVLAGTATPTSAADAGRPMEGALNG